MEMHREYKTMIEKRFSIGTFGFIARAKVDESSVRVDVYEISAVDLETNKPCFMEYDSCSLIEDMDRAEKFVSVFIKWDECANWCFGEESKHTCSRNDVTNFGLIMMAVHDWAMELLEKPD